MKKLNNKGITIIEVLVSFILIVMITVSMFSALSAFNEKRIIEGYKSEIYTFKNILTKEIQDDLIKKGLTHVSYNESVDDDKKRTYTLTFDLKDGDQRMLVIEQLLTKSSYHIGGNPDKPDYFSIKYGTPPNDLIEYTIPNVGSYINENTHQEVRDLSINNVLIDRSNESIIDIYIGLYHPELGTRYAVHIISPINFISSGSDSTESFENRMALDGGSEYEISYNANGGVGNMPSVKTTTDKYFTLPKEGFTKNSYTLKEWNTEPDGRGTSYKLGQNVRELPSSNGKVTLYAIWEPVKYDYSFKGSTETFIAPATGKYKIEVWGASGGAKTYNQAEGSHAGLGGYAVGYINLKEKQKLYITVGGAGKYNNDVVAGGYNGGGANGKTAAAATGSGGGATHVAFATGTLKSLEANKDKVLIVAGGGGGASNGITTHLGSTDGSGGNGGGYLGNPAYVQGKLCNNTVSKVTEIIGCGMGGTQSADYFGYGESSIISINSGGAGGGWYGGYTSSISHGGAGGGSGYINTKYLEYATMYCYNCRQSIIENIKTTSVNQASETATAQKAKIGNGHARITQVS